MMGDYDMGGGFGGDESLRGLTKTEESEIDPDTMVQNLKTHKIELREKIFLDKKISKQLEISMEERPNPN